MHHHYLPTALKFLGTETHIHGLQRSR